MDQSSTNNVMDMDNDNSKNHDVVPLGIPPLRQWELTEHSTRYDRLVAAPSDDGLYVIWTTWVVVTFCISLFVGSVLLSIVVSKSKTTRTNAFNVYVCFMMASDLLFSASCFVTCLLNVVVGHYVAPWMCRFQSFYCVWTIGSSVWMNAVIAWQMHRMLQKSHLRQRYVAPTARRATCHSLVVYAYNAAIAMLGILPASPYIPHQSAAVSGEACLPVEYNSASTYFMFLAFFPLVTVLPILYLAWVCWDIYRRQLMPPSGRRRWLTVYFARITLSLLVMWLPFFVMVFCAGGRPWVNFAGGTIAHLQGAVTAFFVLMKPDTQKAYKDLWCRHKWECCCRSLSSRVDTTFPTTSSDNTNQRSKRSTTMHPTRSSSLRIGNWMNFLGSSGFLSSTVFGNTTSRDNLECNINHDNEDNNENHNNNDNNSGDMMIIGPFDDIIIDFSQDNEANHTDPIHTVSEASAGNQISKIDSTIIQTNGQEDEYDNTYEEEKYEEDHNGSLGEENEECMDSDPEIL